MATGATAREQQDGRDDGYVDQDAFELQDALSRGNRPCRRKGDPDGEARERGEKDPFGGTQADPVADDESDRHRSQERNAGPPPRGRKVPPLCGCQPKHRCERQERRKHNHCALLADLFPHWYGLNCLDAHR
jgi:hypothetical protein